jgi:phytoene/squalene synthetase
MSHRKTDGHYRVHLPLDGRVYFGSMVASQVPQEQPPSDESRWTRELFEAESGFEAAERRLRALERRHGSGPTSVAAARAWATARLEAR